MSYYLERCREELLHYDFEESVSERDRDWTMPNEISVVIMFTTHTGVHDRSGSANLVLKKIGRRPQARDILTAPSVARVQRCGVKRRDRSFLFFSQPKKRRFASLFHARSASGNSPASNEFRRLGIATVVLQSSEWPNRRPGWIIRRIVFNPLVSRAPSFGFRTYIDSKAGSFAISLLGTVSLLQPPVTLSKTRLP